MRASQRTPSSRPSGRDLLLVIGELARAGAVYGAQEGQQAAMLPLFEVVPFGAVHPLFEYIGTRWLLIRDGDSPRPESGFGWFVSAHEGGLLWPWSYRSVLPLNEAACAWLVLKEIRCGC